MKFIGIDLHTNCFTCCYRTEESTRKETVTYSLDDKGLGAFYATLDKDSYVLVEATITTFSFVRLFSDRVKEVVVANTYELKQISLARKNTDKTDADKLSVIIKTQVLSGEKQVVPVTVPPKEIQDLRALFTTYRFLKKQTARTKNRIHSLLKEQLYGFTQEAIFGKKSRAEIREISNDVVLRVQINMLMDHLETIEKEVDALKERVQVAAAPFIRQIEILTSMKGISPFIAIAIIADIIDVGRFRNSKAFTSYLRSAPKVSNSNTSESIKGTNKQGRKLASTLLTQSLNHVLASSPKLDRWYERLCRYKKPGLVRTGLRRRVLAEICQMLKKGECHYGRNPANHQAKMDRFEKILQKAA
jgi:transposase